MTSSKGPVTPAAAGDVVSMARAPAPDERSGASKLKVLYFTAVDLGATSNGGGLCCRQHVRGLAADPDIDLVVAAAGPKEQQEGNRRYVESAGGEFINLPWRDSALPPKPSGPLAILARHYSLPLEGEAAAQPQVDLMFSHIVNARRPDAIIVDYLPSAHYVKSVFRSSPARRFLITLNRESDFVRDLWLNRRPSPLPIDVQLATLRAAWFEHWLYQHAEGLIALTANDLPSHPPRCLRTIVFPPSFAASDPPWTYSGTRSVFFVGNISHYPNREAVQWLCTQLAPTVAKRGGDVRFRIVGAAAADVPDSWHARAIDFLGRSDAEQVKREFATADLFIAPIANNYGSKMKVLECISHGTPFIATPAAMSGLPFMVGIPQIDLARVEQAAQLLVGLVQDPARLRALSRSISDQHRQFHAAQIGAWSRFLHGVPAAHRCLPASSALSQ